MITNTSSDQNGSYLGGLSPTIPTNTITVPLDAPISCAFGLFFKAESESAFDMINVHLLDTKKPQERADFRLEDIADRNDGGYTTAVNNSLGVKENALGGDYFTKATVSEYLVWPC
jgi:hypothetical protein